MVKEGKVEDEMEEEKEEGMEREMEDVAVVEMEEVMEVGGMGEEQIKDT